MRSRHVPVVCNWGPFTVLIPWSSWESISGLTSQKISSVFYGTWKFVTMFATTTTLDPLLNQTDALCTLLSYLFKIPC
jgi:hypothetical protein